MTAEGESNAPARCLDENEAMALVLRSQGADDARRHVDTCEACRLLVAATARLVVSDSTVPGRAWPDAPLPPGTKVGAFVVLEEVGRGSMGRVYAARDERLQRKVALKLLDEGLGRDVALPRLRAEARSMARLGDPHVVEVLDVGRSKHGPFVAMQYVHGCDFRTWLGDARRPREQILDHLQQAGMGLAAAHAAGVVHRDFKPANVLVGEDGVVRVADFGLAVVDHADAVADSAAAGTPAYMAPEQLLGQAAHPLADQFAFCVTAYEALAGHRPFERVAVVARIDDIAAGRIKAPARRVPRRILAVLRRGLAAEATARYPDMARLLDALRRARRPDRRLAIAAGLAVGLGAVSLAWAPAEPTCIARAGSPPAASVTAELQHQWSTRSVPRTTTQRLVRRVNRHVEAWTDVRDEVCVAAVSPAAQEPAIACLVQRRTQLRAYLREAAVAEAEQAEGFASAADALPSPQDCRREGGAAWLADPQLLGDASQLESRFVIAKARGLLGTLPELNDDLHAALQRARDSGATAIESDLAYVLGVFAVARGNAEQAVRAFDQAYFRARELGDVTSAFDAALACSMVEGLTLGDVNAAWRWSRYARAMRRGQKPDHREVSLLIQEGNLHLAGGDLDAAHDSLRAAERSLKPDSAEYLPIELYSSLGQLLSMQQDYAACRAAYQRAIDAVEQKFGVHHRELMRPLAGIATCELEDDDLPKARAHLERTIALAQQHDAPDAEAIARTNLGISLRYFVQPTEALNQLARAQVLVEANYPPTGGFAADAALNVAHAYEDTGRWDEAADNARRARHVLLTLPHDTSASVRECDRIVAHADWMRGRVDAQARLQALLREADEEEDRIAIAIDLAQGLAAQPAEVITLLGWAFDARPDEAPIDELRFAEGALFYADALLATDQPARAKQQLRAALGQASPYEGDDPRRVVARIRARIDAVGY